jgi:tRNA A-37 threonylcarbamoyl transferase component Bud32
VSDPESSTRKSLIALAAEHGMLERGDAEEVSEQLAQRAPGQSEADWLCASGILTPAQVAELSALPGLSGPRPDAFGPVPEIPGYEIIAPLGHGGMGVVYKARQLRPKRIVAIKLMVGGLLAKRSERLRFEREAQAVADLKHPGIVTIYDFGEASGHLYMGMEYVDGLPLTAYLQTHELPLRSKVALMQRICEAVAHAHQHGVIHRDLKPANILVTDAGQPKVLDFGLAKLSETSGAAPLTLTGQDQMLGTVPYMAPEQTHGRGTEADVRTDVFSLGVVFYQMLAGRLPHGDEDTSPLEVMRRVREEAPRRPSTVVRDIAGDVETIVLKALAKDKQRRYQSVDALAADLGRFLADEPIEARRASLAYQLRKFLVRHRWRLLPVAAALLAVCVMAVWSFVRVADERDTARAAQTLAEQRLKESEDALAVTNLFHMLTPPEESDTGDHFRNLDHIERFLAENAANAHLHQVEQRRAAGRQALAARIRTDLQTNDLTELVRMCAETPSRIDVIRGIDSVAGEAAAGAADESTVEVRLLDRVQKRLRRSLLVPAPVGRAQFMRDAVATLLVIDPNDAEGLAARAARRAVWSNMTPLISENFDAYADDEDPPGWDGTYGDEVARVQGDARELFIHSKYGNAGAIRRPMKLDDNVHAIWGRADFRFLPSGNTPLSGGLRIDAAAERFQCAIVCMDGEFAYEMLADGAPRVQHLGVQVVPGRRYRLELRCYPKRGTFDALLDGRFVVEEARMQNPAQPLSVFELKSNHGTRVFADNVELRTSTVPIGRSIGELRPIITQNGIRLRPVRILPIELDFILGADVDGDGQVEMVSGSREPKKAGTLTFYRVTGAGYDREKLGEIRVSEEGALRAVGMVDDCLVVSGLKRLDKTDPDKPVHVGAMQVLRIDKTFSADTVLKIEGEDIYRCEYAPMRFGNGRTGFVLGWGCYRRKCDIFERVVEEGQVSYERRGSVAYPASKEQSDVMSVQTLDIDNDGDDDIFVGLAYWSAFGPILIAMDGTTPQKVTPLTGRIGVTHTVTCRFDTGMSYLVAMSKAGRLTDGTAIPGHGLRVWRIVDGHPELLQFLPGTPYSIASGELDGCEVIVVSTHEPAEQGGEGDITDAVITAYGLTDDHLVPLWRVRFSGAGTDEDGVIVTITDLDGDGRNELLTRIPGQGTLIFAADERGATR